MPWYKPVRQRRPAAEGPTLADVYANSQHIRTHVAGIHSMLSNVHVELAMLRAKVERMEAGADR